MTSISDAQGVPVAGAAATKVVERRNTSVAARGPLTGVRDRLWQVSWRPGAIQEQARMAALSGRLDLLHLPWSEGPVRPLCPFVLTLHDLATIVGASSYELGFRV